MSKKYTFMIFFFIVGLIFISIIKNETRKLQKEINNLKSSIYNIKLDLHEASLDHQVLTSPDNIFKLSKKYLDDDFKFYKKSQIKEFNLINNLELSFKPEEQ